MDEVQMYFCIFNKNINSTIYRNAKLQQSESAKGLASMYLNKERKGAQHTM